jgi:hypothetical protein
MAHTAKRYRKLAKTGGLFTCYSLWQGADHLISVQTTMASEDYRRFYFPDIQSITVQKTGMYHVYSFLFGLPGVLALTVGTLADTTPLPWLIFSVLAGLMLAGNLLRGPTCICHIRTAVQSVRVRALVRMRRLNRVLDQVMPLIAESQKSQPTVPTRPSPEAGAGRPILTAPNQKGAPALPASKARPASVRLHQILFGGLLIQALLSGGNFFVSNLIYGLLASLFVAGIMITTVVALARQADSGINATAKRMTWAALVLMCLEVAAGYGASFWAYTAYPELINNQWGLYKHLVMLSPQDHPLLLGFSLLVTVVALILGLGGTISLRRHRREPTGAPTRDRLQQAVT